MTDVSLPALLAFVQEQAARMRIETSNPLNVRAAKFDAMAAVLTRHAALVEALRQCRKVAWPWIDGAITVGNYKHVPRLTFAEWDAICGQIEAALALCPPSAADP